MGCIYKLTCLVNHRVYVGQTTTSFESRWSRHLSDARNRDPSRAMVITRAIQKHGADAFHTLILFDDISDQAELDALEALMIASERSDNMAFGYNVDPNPRGTGPRSEETKHRISEALKGRVFSEEHRRKLSDVRRGKPAHNKGVPLSEAQRKKLREIKLGTRLVIVDGKRRMIKEQP